MTLNIYRKNFFEVYTDSNFLYELKLLENKILKQMNQNFKFYFIIGYVA